MDQGWFGVLEFGGHVSSQSKVWILVNGTWDQARHIGSTAKDLWERVAERWRSLDGHKVKLSNIIAEEGEGKARVR